MPIFQVDALTGQQIIWVTGDGRNTAGHWTSQDIDNEIVMAMPTSIMEVHRALYNQWLIDCKISTDIGGAAETSIQQALFVKAYKLLVYYAYSKQSIINDMQMGKCKEDCEKEKKQWLKTFSEDVICSSITNTCLKEKYLNWLHNVCDKQTLISGLLTSEVISDNCHDRHYRRFPNIVSYDDDNDCGCCGG